MNSLEKTTFDRLKVLIDEKISQISLAIRVQLVKNNNFVDISQSVSDYLQNEIYLWIEQKIDNINVDLINERLNTIVSKYLKSLKRKK